MINRPVARFLTAEKDLFGPSKTLKQMSISSKKDLLATETSRVLTLLL